MEISKQQARELALTSQLYRQQALSGKTGVLDLIRQLSYVQIDTISVVERAHHHTIWNRISSYRKDWLDELLAKDRAVFEHWGHAASYLPMEDYRYSLPRMERFPNTTSWEKRFFETHLQPMQFVLERIKAEGALGARDFENNGKQKTDYGWGTGKPEKIALELLLWKGELMVERRDKFQRIYNLRERILPDWVDTSFPDTREINRHHILKALGALGIATAADLRNHFMLKQSQAWNKTLLELLEAQEVNEVSVAAEKDKYYALPETLDTLQDKSGHPEKLFILSPFDNAVILRNRVKRLFGFDYTLECYVPPHKRVYGYWSLPLLYQGKFIGRMDCKAQRSQGILEVLSVHWEEGRKPDREPKTALQNALQDFAGFNGCLEFKL